MRIHGSIVALKQGVPAIAIVPDSRILEMCQLFKIPFIKVDQMQSSDFNIERLYNDANYDDMNKAYLQLLNEYIAFLDKNGLQHKLIKQ